MSDSDAVVFRPRNLIIWASGFTLLLLIAAAIGWFALPAHIRVLFTWFQISTLLFFITVAIVLMMGLAMSMVRADRDGLVVRNFLVQKRVAWEHIASFRYAKGDPWAYALLDDSDDPPRQQLLAIQTPDGERAHAAVRRLREMLAQYKPS